MTIERARELRRRMTDAEVILWQRLRNERLGVKFRRQEPAGPFVVDFLCRSENLVVEVDGSQHANSARDEQRDLYLACEGFRVLRFWNTEVIGNAEGVIEVIRRHLRLS